MYNGLTNAGTEYLATRQAQSLPVTFTKVKIGSGAPASGVDPASLADVVNEMMETEIYDKSQLSNVATLMVQISNENVSASFYMTELAFFVDDNGTDVMYWYYNTAEGRIIRDSSTPMSYRPIFNIAVSNLPSLTLDYTGKNLWVDKSYLQTFTDALKAEIITSISGGTYGGFIQATGTKTAGNTYIDSNTGNIMLCINTTTSTSPNSDFTNFTNKALYNMLNRTATYDCTILDTANVRLAQLQMQNKIGLLRIGMSNIGSNTVSTTRNAIQLPAGMKAYTMLDRTLWTNFYLPNASDIIQLLEYKGQNQQLDLTIPIVLV